MVEDPNIEYLRDLINSETYNVPEKTLMQIEQDYMVYKYQTRWEDHILKIASEEVI